MDTHEIDAKSAANATAPRISLDYIKQRIAKREFQVNGVTTICILTMVNGFKVIGHTTPASPENFNQALGRELAEDQAIRQVWPLEGYLLRERLTNPVFCNGNPPVGVLQANGGSADTSVLGA